MKALEQLFNTDKAELLHQLFPDEIPFLLDYMAAYSREMIEAYDEWKETYDQYFIDEETWLGYMESTATIIKEYGKRMKSSKRLFADQLFDGLLACYTNHCIATYVQTKKYRDPKVYYAAHMLYNISDNI